MLTPPPPPHSATCPLRPPGSPGCEDLRTDTEPCMPAYIPAPSMNHIICQIGIPRDSIRRGNAQICSCGYEYHSKKFLNPRHATECGLLSGLLARPNRCRWPIWRCADRGQVSDIELETLRRLLVWPTRIMSIVCPFGSCLPQNSRFRFRVFLPEQAVLDHRIAKVLTARGLRLLAVRHSFASATAVPIGGLRSKMRSRRGLAVRHGAVPSGSRPSRR